MTDWVEDRKRTEARAAAARPKTSSHPKLKELRAWVGPAPTDDFLVKVLEQSKGDVDAAATCYFKRTGATPVAKRQAHHRQPAQPSPPPQTGLPVYAAAPVYAPAQQVAYAQPAPPPPPAMPVYTQPAYTTMSVTVPPGYCGGHQLQVRTADGRLVQVQIPFGLSAGHTFPFQVPPAPGGAVAAAMPPMVVQPMGAYATATYATAAPPAPTPAPQPININVTVQAPGQPHADLR
mmetsp:Transcript_16112/g.34978  ORF Transcript_16112/g.34978 Transcript_16112/m.34978 type:complete len:234 (-) Transcript_16112:141-842(-)